MLDRSHTSQPSSETGAIYGPPPSVGDGASAADLRRVGLVAFGHFTNDMYGNLATAMAPYLVLSGRLSAPAAGALVLVFLAGSSILQPVFGIVSDRSGRRWFAVAGPAGIGCCMTLVVMAPQAWEIFLLVALGGIATAAFHPQAASMVSRLSGGSRGWSMGIFSAGGNFGYGLGPLLATVLVSIGSGWTLVAAIPGLFCSGLLFRSAPTVKSQAMESTRNSLRAARANMNALARIVLVIAIRSGAMSAVIFLAPLYFHAQNLPPRWGSYGSTLFLLAGALCGLYAGRLSDRVGRRPVVVYSLIISAPLILLIGLVPGLASWPIMALAGMAIVASNSVTVVQAQELLPDNVGLAAGLTLGLGFGISGVITVLVSILSKQVGAQDAILAASGLPLIAAGIAAMGSAQSTITGRLAECGKGE